MEDYTSVSTECLKEVDSKRQIEARESEVEEHSTEDQTTQLTETMEEKNTGEIKSTEKVSSLIFKLLTYPILLNLHFHQQTWHKQSSLAHTRTQCETSQPEDHQCNYFLRSCNVKVTEPK